MVFADVRTRNGLIFMALVCVLFVCSCGRRRRRRRQHRQHRRRRQCLPGRKSLLGRSLMMCFFGGGGRRFWLCCKASGRPGVFVKQRVGHYTKLCVCKYAKTHIMPHAARERVRESGTTTHHTPAFGAVCVVYIYCTSMLCTVVNWVGARVATTLLCVSACGSAVQEPRMAVCGSNYPEKRAARDLHTRGTYYTSARITAHS